MARADADRRRRSSARRKDGAAVALDDLDRRLLNLMQGSFPLDPRPYAAVAEAAELREAGGARARRRVCSRSGSSARSRRSTTLARSATARCSSRRRSIPSTRGAAAKIINSHPGVSHNYLRNHEFNMWFTIAVERDSKLGLDGTLDVLARADRRGVDPPAADAQAVQDPHGPRDGGRHAGACLARRARRPPRRSEAIDYDERDMAVIRATQGDLPVVAEPYAAAAAALGMGVGELLEHMTGMRERGLLRRVAAILYHRRAGFSANGMGVWKVPAEQIEALGPRMASYRGISHCYQRPTYTDWPYSVFTMAHGRSKEECDAVLDAIAGDTGSTERATLYSSTEFKKIRLLYFTDEFKRVGGGARLRRARRSRARRVGAREAIAVSGAQG